MRNKIILENWIIIDCFIQFAFYSRLVEIIEIRIMACFCVSESILSRIETNRLEHSIRCNKSKPLR